MLVMIVQPRAESPIEQARVSVAAGKKLGGAVVRNRVKRKLRTAIQQVYEHLPALIDVIIIARQPSLTATVDDLTKALTATLKRAQLWQDRSKPAE